MWTYTQRSRRRHCSQHTSLSSSTGPPERGYHSTWRVRKVTMPTIPVNSDAISRHTHNPYRTTLLLDTDILWFDGVSPATTIEANVLSVFFASTASLSNLSSTASSHASSELTVSFNAFCNFACASDVLSGLFMCSSASMRIVSSRWQISSSTSLYLAMSFAIVVNSSQILLTSFVPGVNLVERNADSATTGAMKICHERCDDQM